MIDVIDKRQKVDFTRTFHKKRDAKIWGFCRFLQILVVWKQEKIVYLSLVTIYDNTLTQNPCYDYDFRVLLRGFL